MAKTVEITRDVSGTLAKDASAPCLRIDYRLSGVTRNRPILMVADQAWDARGGGAVILHSLIDHIIGDGLVWVTPSRADCYPACGHYGLLAGSAGRGSFSILSDTLWHADDLATEIRELADHLNAAALWVVLHGASVALASRLARACSLPMHVSVHDDPVYATALRSRRLALFAPLIARQFRKALQAARSVDVVCDAMGERYRRKYGVDSVVLHRGLVNSVAPAPVYDIARQGIRVGIIGNNYSYNQLSVLAYAVELAAVRLGVRSRLIICGDGFGERLRREFTGRVEIDVLGYLSEEVGIDHLRRCVALYLNYPFGWSNRVLRETSFPTKLSTYVQAARPILVHAPPGSSVSGFEAAASGYVIPWETMNPHDGADRLTKLIADSKTTESFHQFAEKVRRRYYDLDAHRVTLDRLLRNLVNGSSVSSGTLS